MSFTYRPSTGAEILKKKSTAKPTAKILGFIQEHYSSGIVLEPNTDFKNIKILREVENKVSLPVLKRKLISAKIPINGLKISFGNGSGGGKGGGSRGGAEVTALAESLQCYYNSYYWEKGITASEPTEDDLKKQQKYCFTDRTLTKCLAAKEIKSWRDDNVFDKIAKELKSKFNTKFLERPKFHRGSTFMNNIYAAKATVHKNDKETAKKNTPPTLPQAPGSFSNDKWNPGDIWKTTLSADTEPLKDHVCTWGSLNDEVEHLANTGKLMGVSLKRVDAEKARTTFFNKKNEKKEKQRFEGFSFGSKGEFFNSIDFECFVN